MAGYPSYRYHATEDPRIVNDEAEDKALGKGWADSPAKVSAEPTAHDGPYDDGAEPPKAKGKGKK